MNKLLTVAMLFMALCMAAPTFAQSEGKMGLVDIQLVIRNSKAGQSAKQSFEKDFREKKRVIDQKQSSLDMKKEEYLQKAPVVTETVRKKMADELEDSDKKLKRLREDYRIELQKKDFELTQRILEQLEKVIKSYGTKNGFLIIIEKTEGGVVYSSSSADLTDDIIKAYDKSKGL